MTTVIRTSSRSTYTTLLTPVTQRPSASLECVAHHDSPHQAQQPFSSLESPKAHEILNEINNFSPNGQGMGNYNVLLTPYLMKLDLDTYSIGLLRCKARII